MTNPSPATNANRPVALVIAVQMRLASQQRPSPQAATARRVALALHKAQQSSPAMRRQPAAVKALAAKLRPLAAGNPAKRPLGAAAKGVGALGAARKITTDARKAFRRGEGKVKVESSHDLSPHASRHADAAAAGLRRGGLGLLSAAYHGVAAARDLRKTTRQARKDFERGQGEPNIQSSHSLSPQGSHHADAAAAGLRRGGFGLLSAAYHGVQALRDVRRSAHGAAVPSSSSGDRVGPQGHDGAHGAPSSQWLQSGSFAKSGLQVSVLSLSKMGASTMTLSSSGVDPGSLPWQAIGQGLQTLQALAHPPRGQGGSSGARSPQGGASPLAVMLIARGRVGGGGGSGIGSGVVPGLHRLAIIEEEGT